MNINKVIKDLYLMIFFTGLSLLLLFFVIPSQIKVPALASSETFNPQTYPRLLAIGMLIVSIIGLVKTIIDYLHLKKIGVNQHREESYSNKKQETLFPYLIFSCIVVYMLIFRFWGIVPATLIIPPCLLYLLNCRSWNMYLFLYLFAGLVYILFTRILLVPLR